MDYFVFYFLGPEIATGRNGNGCIDTHLIKTLGQIDKDLR